MGGDSYKIQDQHATYFLTINVIYWIDLFTRIEYKEILVDSLNYCIRNKGLEVNAWVIMSNHLHLVASVHSKIGMSGFLRDFKKYTSKQIIRRMGEINESRKTWLLDKFSFEAKRSGRANKYKIWKDGNHAIDLSDGNIDLYQKIDYIHLNPVFTGLVDLPEDYRYSSARDYDDPRGLVDVTLM